MPPSCSCCCCRSCRCYWCRHPRASLPTLHCTPSPPPPPPPPPRCPTHQLSGLCPHCTGPPPYEPLPQLAPAPSPNCPTHQLLVLVQLLQVVHRHRVNANRGSLLAMLVVTQHAHLPGEGGGGSSASKQSGAAAVTARQQTTPRPGLASDSSPLSTTTAGSQPCCCCNQDTRSTPSKRATPAAGACLELGAGAVGQLHGAAETLVLLRVIVLQANLQLDGLSELALLLLGTAKHACRGGTRAGGASRSAAGGIPHPPFSCGCCMPPPVLNSADKRQRSRMPRRRPSLPCAPATLPDAAALQSAQQAGWPPRHAHLRCPRARLRLRLCSPCLLCRTDAHQVKRRKQAWARPLKGTRDIMSL